MAVGSAIGGVVGGIIGAIPTFGIGAAPGAAAGSALGGLVEGGVRWGQAQKKTIDPTDYNQRILLNEIMNKRKMLEAGTMYSPQQESIQQVGALAMNRAMRASGGNIGATMQALLAAQRGTGRGLNELYGNMMGQSVNMMGLQNQLTQEMANRSLGLQMYDKQQSMVHGANTLQSGLENIMALMASRGGNIDNAVNNMTNARNRLGGTGTPVTPTASMNQPFQVVPQVGVQDFVTQTPDMMFGGGNTPMQVSPAWQI